MIDLHLTHPKLKLTPLPEQPLVGILIRTMNRPLTLARALQSVLNQEYANWHIYLLNNGGDPEPIKLLLELNKYEIDGRVTLINSPDNQRDNIISFGLKYFKTDLMILHDDDDSWTPCCLAKMVSALMSHPNNVACACSGLCNNELINHLDKDITELAQTPWAPWESYFDVATALYQCTLLTHGLLVRLEVAQQLGYYNDLLPVAGDWEFASRLATVGPVVSVDEALVNYHLRLFSYETGSYGNSVVSLVKFMDRFNILMRNSFVRKAISEKPYLLGVLHVLSHELGERSAEVKSYSRNLRQKYIVLERKYRQLEKLISHNNHE